MSDENKFSLIDLPDIPDSVDNALKNLTDQPTQNAGQTFGDIWYLVFGGISHAADKKRMKYAHDLEAYRQELDQAINSIPEDKKLEPSIQITARALENSKYCVSSETLRGMFTQLISGTMNSDIEPLTHPSFSEIINQMDENDAHLLMELKRKGHVPIANYKEITQGKQGYCIRFSNAYISTVFNLPLDKCNSSLSLLERMGLVSLSFDTHFIDKKLYAPFTQTDLYLSLVENKPSNVRYEVQEGICEITPLGQRFLNCCVL